MAFSTGGSGQRQFLFPNQTNQVLQEGSQINISWTGATSVLDLAIASDGKPSWQNNIGGVDIMQGSHSYFLWVVTTQGAPRSFDSSTPFYFKLTAGDAVTSFRSVNFHIDDSSSSASPTVPSGTSSSPTSAIASPTSTSTNTSNASSAAQATVTVTMTATGGLSAGAKAGIGVGVAIAVLLVIGAIAGFLLYRRRSHSKQPSLRSMISAPVAHPPAQQRDLEADPPIPVHQSMESPQQKMRELPHELESTEFHPAELAATELAKRKRSKGR